MEIEITRFVETAEPFEFSASRAERGVNAGPETWANAVGEAEVRPLLTTNAELDALRAWAAGFGAWEREEIAAWSPAECNALLIQFLSGDMREAESLAPGDGPGGIDWNAYTELQAEGTCSSTMYLDADDRVFAYLGR